MTLGHAEEQKLAVLSEEVGYTRGWGLSLERGVASVVSVVVQSLVERGDALVF